MTVHKVGDVSIKFTGANNVLQKRQIPQFSRNEKYSGIVTQWTITDWDGELSSFEFKGAGLGDLHVHRNRLRDQVRLWMNVGPGLWEECMNAWLVYTSTSMKSLSHPAKPTHILDAFGTEKWIPSYVATSTYNARLRNHDKRENLLSFNKNSK